MNLVPLLWGLFVIAFITLLSPYVITGRRQVQKWGWGALLPIHRVTVTQTARVTLDFVQRAIATAEQEIIDSQPKLVRRPEAATVNAVYPNLYRITLDGDTYWLRTCHDRMGTPYIQIRQGIPHQPPNPQTVILFIVRVLTVRLLDPSGRAFLVAQKMSGML